VHQLQARHGDAAAIAAVVAHREQYLTDADLDRLKQLGYRHVRLPVTWACFFGGDDAPEAIVQDPVGPARYCSPRLRISGDLKNKGSQRVSMTWLAMFGCP